MAELTLTDFLLARIAEGEDAIRRNWNGRTGMTDERWWGTPFQPSRALAECEAKRQIVSYCDMLDRGPALGAFSEAEASHARHTLRCLALPSADHPDYREEWRP